MQTLLLGDPGCAVGGGLNSRGLRKLRQGTSEIRLQRIRPVLGKQDYVEGGDGSAGVRRAQLTTPWRRGVEYVWSELLVCPPVRILSAAITKKKQREIEVRVLTIQILSKKKVPIIIIFK